ncbi:hypothetical protein GMSM_08030 [Geomonas sp. Red276]
MTCNCPKCHATIELDLPEVTEQGTSATCPSCNASFNIYRESFGGRAFRKSSELSCASCGEQLGPENHCRTCGAPFPDYVVAGLGRRKAVRKVTKLELKSSPFQRKVKYSPTLPTLDDAMNLEGGAGKKTSTASRDLTKGKKIAIALLVVSVIALAGTGVYLKKKAEDTYIKNFAQATYAVQLGADKCRKVSQKLAADWKARTDAGQPFTPRIGVMDEKDLGIISDKIADLKRSMGKEPGKFEGCTDKLGKIEAPYNKMKNLVLNPGNSLATFIDSANKLDAEYNAGASDFKGSIPPEALVRLRQASQHYIGLRQLFK